MGAENDIFWSEIGSGFGKPGGTPPLRIPRNTPPGCIHCVSSGGRLVSWIGSSLFYTPYKPSYHQTLDLSAILKCVRIILVSYL